jgi:hypothetical protein
MPIRGEGSGLTDAGSDTVENGGVAGEAGSNTTQQKLVYVLHPNCAVEEV